MSVAIVLAALKDKELLKELMTAYLAETNDDDHAGTDYPYFDDYWTDATRWPYFITLNNEIAGFALINQWSVLGLPTDFAIAEFFISPAYRRNKIGKSALQKLIQTHKGLWEISVSLSNSSARYFWKQALTANNIKDIECHHTSENEIYRFRIGMDASVSQN